MWQIKDNTVLIRVLHLNVPVRINQNRTGGYFMLAGETFHLELFEGEHVDKETITRRAERLVYHRFVDLLENRHHERQTFIDEIREMI